MEKPEVKPAVCEVGQGTHLHYAVMIDGAWVDPMNYLPA